MSKDVRANSASPGSSTFEPDALGELPSAQDSGLARRLYHWWKQQTAPRIEDEVVDRGGAPISRFVLPVVVPVLLVPAVLLIREPGNMLAVMTLIAGGVAILYSLVGSYLERSMVNPFWLALANGAVYSSIISLLLWTFGIYEHPREHLHWVIFFLYFLMIGANGMSDDPRQPMTAGAFAIAGYILAVIALRAAAASGESTMALRVAPEFEWVANSAKIALLFGTTVVSACSAQRGRELRRSSLRDGLTGLLNRHALDQCLEHLGRSATRERHTLTIAMVDIDHFKGLNDRYGHPTGDDVLRWVAGWLEDNFRATDLVARYGGEEFVVAFPDTADRRIDERLEALREGIANRCLRARGCDDELSVTVSIGAARLPDEGRTVQELLALADARLYAAKEGGRNCIVSA